MILFRIYDLFTMSVYDGNGRKTSKYTKNIKGEKNKGKKKSPFVALPSPRLKRWRPTVFGVRKHRKQAGPTLGGAGTLI